MELTLDLINKATSGDHQAMQDILFYYNHYIDALSAYEYEDENGVTQRRVDLDIKAELQYKLMEAIKKWKELI